MNRWNIPDWLEREVKIAIRTAFTVALNSGRLSTTEHQWRRGSTS
jgi:hypothetical protein